MSKCEDVVRSVRASIERLTAMDHIILTYRELEPYITDDIRDAYEKLRELFIRKLEDEWKDVEKHLRELPRVCR